MANERQLTSKINRLGFQYYNDVDHFDEASLSFWLPKLTAAGTRWIVLPIPESAEIPENFLREIVAAGIEPIIRVGYSLKNLPSPSVFRERIAYYQGLGVHLVQFFHAPNLKSSWKAADWRKADPVERFVVIFQTYARICVELKVIPIFPTLVAGGDYPDLAFLAESLRLMKTDGNALISNLFLSADAGFQEHATEWGKGGPIVEAGRLNLSETDEDHRGFHIYEWYNAVVGSVLGRPIPMILMEVGRWSSETGPFDLIPAQSKKQQTDLLRQIQEPATVANEAERIPGYVISANFYKLPSESAPNAARSARLLAGGNLLSAISNGLRNGFAFTDAPAGRTIRSAKTVREELDSGAALLLSRIFPDFFNADEPLLRQLIVKLIDLLRRGLALLRGRFSGEGYFLIPDLDNELDAAQSQLIELFVKSTKVRSGHNLNEAIGAKKVILLDDQSLYPNNIIHLLQRNQCSIQTLSVVKNER